MKIKENNWRSRKKQVNTLKTLKTKEQEAIKANSDDNKKHLKYIEVFNELSDEKIGETKNISKEIDFNNLAYNFKCSNAPPTNFMDFRGLKI